MKIKKRELVKGGVAIATLAGLGRYAPSVLGKEPGANKLYEDPLFTKPFIDVDEMREAPAPHRYVHGGFRDTDLRFSMYFPPEKIYDGRFLHPVMHIAGDENVAPKGRLGGLQTAIEFAFASGAYLVESNQGSRYMGGPADITNFRASAATAQYGRILAEKMYGRHRPYGYVFGGSGGSYKTFACVENTSGIWDGSVPFIHGSPAALPNMFTVQAHALRLLDGKFEQIIDAVAPGGSGDMYAGLNEEESAALKEVTLMGFPPRAWFAHDRVALGYTGVFASLMPALAAEDPAYFSDFWTKPGYLGFDAPQSLRDARIRETTTIAGILSTRQMLDRGLPVSIAAGTRDTAPAAIRLADMPAGRLEGSYVTPQSGGAAGERMMVTGVIGDMVMLGFGGQNIATLEKMKTGDKVSIDNSDYLASQTYHRHQVQSAGYYVWDQFKDDEGKPKYPQRPILQSYNQAGEGNNWQTGRFSGKMITINSILDEAAYPWQVDWYRKRVMAHFGEAYKDRYRVWFNDHAMHVYPSRYLSPNEGEAAGGDDYGPATTHVIRYEGILQQAIRDVAAWAEKGIEPPQSSKYEVENSQIALAGGAKARGGVQPVVRLTANSDERADVKVGEKVEFAASIEMPPGAGMVVSTEWDYDGQGKYPEKQDYKKGKTKVTLRNSRSWSRPGTYFVTLRASSQRERAVGTPFGQAYNLAKVRVVVN